MTKKNTISPPHSSIPISDEKTENKEENRFKKLLKTADKKKLGLALLAATLIIGLLSYLFLFTNSFHVPKIDDGGNGTLTVTEIGDFPYKDKTLTLEDFQADSEVHFKKDYPIGRVVGIVNKGNSCYGNSAIQMLYRIPAIRSVINNLDFYLDQIKSNVTDLSEKDTKMENMKILEGLNHVFYQLENNGPSNPARLEGKSLQCFPDKYAASGQQDAQEYTNMLIKAIQSVIPPNQFSEYLEIVIEQAKSVNFVDPKHKKEETKFEKEVHNSLLLKIPEDRDDKEAVPLEDLLNDYMIDIFDAEFENEVIGTRENIRKFCHLPNILPLFVSRNKYDKKTGAKGKCHNLIKDIFEVNISKYMIEPESSPQSAPIDITLNLIMFVIHLGGASGGHYVSYVLHEDRWFLINDEIVTHIIKLKDVQNIAKSASFLYYKVNKN